MSKYRIKNGVKNTIKIPETNLKIITEKISKKIIIKKVR